MAAAAGEGEARAGAGAGAGAGLEAYLDPGFDALEHSRALTRGDGAEECLRRLQRQRASVESALSTHVAEHNAELMARLAGTEGLRAAAQANKEHAGALAASLGRLSRDVSDPFRAMKRDAAKLRNLQRACKVLDRTRRFLAEVNKLKAQLLAEKDRAKDPAKLVRSDLNLPASGRELARAAQMVHEIEYLLESGDLAGLAIIDRERDWLIMASKGLRSRTEAVLNKAITELNQVEAAAALQAFFNLGILPSRVDAAVDWVVSKVAEETCDALDAHTLGDAVEQRREKRENPGANGTADPAAAAHGKPALGSGGLIGKGRGKGRAAKSSSRIKPPSGEEGEWREALWDRVKAQEASIRMWSLRVWNLQRVLAKKRDPVTHVCFADQILHAGMASQQEQHQHQHQQQSSEKGGKGETAAASRGVVSKRRVRPESVYERYWRLMTQAVHGEIEKASRLYPFVRNELGVQRYPKLRAMFRALPGKLAQRTAGKSVASVGGTNEEVLAMVRALQPLLEWFLAQSLRRLNQPVEFMFPEVESARALAAKQNLLPTRNDILTFAGTLSNELAAVHNDVDLASAVGRGASSAISSFAAKADYIVVHDPDAFVFPGGASSSRGLDGAGTGGEKSGGEKSGNDEGSAMSGARTAAQVHNVAILTLVLKLEALVAEMPEKTTPAKLENRDQVVRAKGAALRVGSERLQEVVHTLLGDYLAGAARALDVALARIHQEDFCRGIESSGEMEADSPYLTAFESAVMTLRTEHLEKLPVEFSIVPSMCRALQARVVSMFARHVSLVRPLDANGRLRLARDLAQFELAVAPLAISSSAKLQDIGDAYTELRGVRELLFAATAEEEGPVDASVEALLALAPKVRFSTLVHTVFADAPPELRSLASSVQESRIAKVGALGDELAYSHVLDGLELEAAEPKRASSKGAGAEASLASSSAAVTAEGPVFLKVGTRLAEPRGLQEYIREHASVSMDKYMQILSARDDAPDGAAVCRHYRILERLLPQLPVRKAPSAPSS